MVSETSRVSLFPRHAWVLIYYLWWHTCRGYQLMPASSVLWLSTGSQDKHSRKAGTWTPRGCLQPLRRSRVCFYFTQHPSYFSGDQGRHLMLTQDVKGWTTAKSESSWPVDPHWRKKDDSQRVHSGAGGDSGWKYTTWSNKCAENLRNAIDSVCFEAFLNLETPWEALWYLEPKFLLVLCNSP